MSSRMDQATFENMLVRMKLPPLNKSKGETMSHTPEPWISKSVVTKSGFAECQRWIEGPIGYGHIALLADGQGRSFNAERIIACVNGCAGLNPAAYRACVEALKRIVSILPDGNSPSHLQAKQALAQAEGKE